MNSDAGMTLVETMVAVMVAATATLLAGSAYLTLVRLARVWQEDLRLTTVFHVTAERLAGDLYATASARSGDSLLVLQLAEGDSVSYRIQGGHLMRNSVRMYGPLVGADWQVDVGPSGAGPFRVRLRLDGWGHQREGDLFIQARRHPPWVAFRHPSP